MAIENLGILEDGKNNWKEKKELTMSLAESFLRLANKKENEIVRDKLIIKSERISHCSDYLEFIETVDGKKKLINARFCRIRLCPMCTWRRSKKVFAQVSKIIQEINKDKEREYIFLTLTCKNVTSEDLKQQIKDLLQSFKRMMDGSSSIKKISLGYFRALEVTRNNNGTYHPHIHCIICVNKSYFKSKNYINQKKWCEIWQHYLKTTYTPVIDIRKASKNFKQVTELAKYTVKPADIILNSEEETDNNIMILSNALHRVRLIGMGGVFKEYHKKLNLEDMNKDDANLIETSNIDDDSIVTDIILKYNWNIGYKNYILQKK